MSTIHITSLAVMFMTMHSNQEQSKKLFEKYKPTHVIHLAALGAYVVSRIARRVLTRQCSRWTLH